MSIAANLLEDIPRAGGEEEFWTLLERGGVRIERIVSHGHRSPEGFWHDQAQDEWVLVVSGRARVRFEGEVAIEMRPGSYLHIPARRRHRVEWTDPDQPTVWVAVHLGGDAGTSSS